MADEPKEIGSIGLGLLDNGRVAIVLNVSTPIQAYMMLEAAKEEVLRWSLEERPLKKKLLHSLDGLAKL